MKSFIKNAPMLKDNCIAFKIIIPILSVISSVFILAPVIVGFKSEFTATSQSAIHLFFRDLFGISLIVCSVIYAFSKNTFFAGIAALFGFITSLFPLISEFSNYIDAKNFAEKFSVTADYSTYLVSIGAYLLLSLLCLFTLLYLIGILPNSLIVLILSALSVLAVIFISIEKYFTFGISLFETLCFAYASLAALIPIFLVLSTKKRKSDKSIKHEHKTLKYQPKRMKP